MAVYSQSTVLEVTLRNWHIKASDFLHLASTCCFQPSLASRITPRYFRGCLLRVVEKLDSFQLFRFVSPGEKNHFSLIRID